MNLLIVKLSAIGDVVQALPFLSAVRRAWPGGRVTWLVEEAAADLLTDHPLLDRVIVSRRKTWVGQARAGRLGAARRDAAAFFRELRAEEYDVVVDLQGLFKSAILAFSSRGRRRVGFDGGRECSSMFLNEQLPAYDPDRHAVLRYLDVADYLGAPTEDTPKLDFPRHDRAAEEAERLLAGLASPRVVVNPGAKWVTKLWPAGHWQRLCGLLTEKAGLQVLLTGGPDEQAINARIGAGLTGLIDLTGRTRLKVLAEVMRAADLVICPDTGPMHLAAAVGTPVTALFGPTAPWRTGPFGPGHVVLRLESGCGPCFKKQCPDPHCMTGLTPETVFDKALDRLEKGRI